MRLQFAVAGLVLLLVALSLGTPVAAAQEWEFGLRGGGDATGAKESYNAGEVYLLRTLPWQGKLSEGVTWKTRLDMGAGYLESGGDEGGWVAAGVNLVVGLYEGVLELDAGFRPAWLYDHRFGRDDFGGDMQFSSHAGVALHVRNVTLSYRFQHISNAGIYDSNPGLDLHLVGIGYRF